MKLLSSTAFAALLLASSAIAADLTPQPPVAPQPVSEPAAFSWSGFYLGAEGGYGWLAGKIPETLITTGATEAASGGAAGIFAGFDHQFDNKVVAGIEGFYGYNWNDTSYTVSSPLPILNGQTVAFGTHWRAGVEGRLGYAFGRTLVFISGGYAATQLEGNFSLTGRDYDEVLNGWTAGLGVDHAFTDRVFARLKMTYSDYGNTDLVTKATGVAALSDTKMTQASLTAGIGFKF